MSLSPAFRHFLDRIADGAVDTIETTRLESGHEPILATPEGRAAGRYVAVGTLAHLVSLAEQAGATGELMAVLNSIGGMFIAESGEQG